MFVSAVKLMESIGLGRSKYVVPPVAPSRISIRTKGWMKRRSRCINRPTRSRRTLGADSPQLAKHLQKLGGAYEKQGKMEAATLTLEEADSVLEHAYGPDHPEVLALREQLAALIEPDPEPEEEEEEEEEVLRRSVTVVSADWSAMGVPEAEEKKDKARRSRREGVGGAAAEEKGTEEKEGERQEGREEAKGKRAMLMVVRQIQGPQPRRPREAKNSITLDER